MGEPASARSQSPVQGPSEAKGQIAAWDTSAKYVSRKRYYHEFNHLRQERAAMRRIAAAAYGRTGCALIQASIAGRARAFRSAAIAIDSSARAVITRPPRVCWAGANCRSASAWASSEKLVMKFGTNSWGKSGPCRAVSASRL